MSSITLGKLKQTVLERSDMVYSGFIADSELTAIINSQASELHDLIVNRYEDIYLTFDTVAVLSDGVMAVPANMYKFRGIDRSDAGTFSQVRTFSWDDRNRRSSMVTYRISGSSIFLHPADLAPGTYRVWYVPQFVNLVTDADTLTVPENLHEFVIAGSAAVCLSKEESDPSFQLGLKAAAALRVQNLVNQDASKNAVMIHVRRPWQDDDFCGRDED